MNPCCRLRLLALPSTDRLRYRQHLEQVGYLVVGDEAPAFDALVIDARERPRMALKAVDQLRREGPMPVVVLADPLDSFVYRHVAGLRRSVVLYAPLSASDLQEALDGVTADGRFDRSA